MLIVLFQVRQGPKPQVLSDNNPVPGQPQHLVYLEKLRKLRAQGGLESDSKNVDQENVENYSNTVPGSSGFGEWLFIVTEILLQSLLSPGTGYNSMRSQSAVSNNRFAEASISSNQATDNYQVGRSFLSSI